MREQATEEKKKQEKIMFMLSEDDYEDALDKLYAVSKALRRLPIAMVPYDEEGRVVFRNWEGDREAKRMADLIEKAEESLGELSKILALANENIVVRPIDK